MGAKIGVRIGAGIGAGIVAGAGAGAGIGIAAGGQGGSAPLALPPLPRSGHGGVAVAALQPPHGRLLRAGDRRAGERPRRGAVDDNGVWRTLCDFHSAGCVIGTIALACSLFAYAQGNIFHEEEGRELFGLVIITIWMSLCRSSAKCPSSSSWCYSLEDLTQIISSGQEEM
ncbi:transmembrane protein 220 isoform X2 [Pseudopipra pipra]|uniref:transmembrane protein 220 isoform X2 n=1 Tax=Pseudopipra pipra TaxID=415032 RepID=UPI00313A0F54